MDKEFSQFMKIKQIEQKKKSSSYKILWYETIILWTKVYTFEILEDRKWWTKMLDLREVRNNI